MVEKTLADFLVDKLNVKFEIFGVIEKTAESFSIYGGVLDISTISSKVEEYFSGKGFGRTREELANYVFESREEKFGVNISYAGGKYLINMFSLKIDDKQK